MLPLYERIEALCEEKNLNITQMCKLAKVPRSALSDYKTGRKKSISLQNIEKIADFFETSVDWLLGKETQKEKAPAKAEADEDPLSQVSFALFGTHEEIDEDLLDDVRSYARFKLEQQRKAAEEKK